MTCLDNIDLHHVFSALDLLFDHKSCMYWLTGDIAAVLQHGNVKHGESASCTTDRHLAHAAAHCAQKGNEEESGLPHRAHTVARLILAIKTEMENEEHEQNSTKKID